MKYEAKENDSRQRNCLLKITYYKLRAEKHLGYYIIGLGNKGYGVGGAEEILNQTLMISRVRRGWKPMGKKPKFMARMGLRSSQRHGGTMTNAMQSDLPDTVWDVMQANHQDDASGVDKSHHVIHSQSKAFQLSGQI